MKALLDTAGKVVQQVLSILASPLFQLAAVGVVFLLVWRKLFGGRETVREVVERTIDSAATIPGGLSSAAGSWLRGESERKYVSQDEARRLAAAQLSMGGLQ